VQPAADALIGNIEPTLGEQVPYVAKAQGEAQVQPDGVPDHGWRILVASKGD
jgi:hypothetical protein